MSRRTILILVVMAICHSSFGTWRCPGEAEGGDGGNGGSTEGPGGGDGGSTENPGSGSGDQCKIPQLEDPIKGKCCKIPEVTRTGYQMKGQLKEKEVGTMSTYETGNLSSSKILICVIDIFGFVNNNTAQFMDILGSTNEYFIVAPDFFRGNWFKMEDLIPPGFGNVTGWIDQYGNYGKTIKHDLQDVISHYNKAGDKTFAMFGFCWGAKMCAEGGAELNMKAIALSHPFLLDKPDCDKVTIPALFAPSKDEPADEVGFMKDAKNRLGDKGHFYHFSDVGHGFAAGRGKWETNDLEVTRVNQLTKYICAFFEKHF